MKYFVIALIYVFVFLVAACATLEDRERIEPKKAPDFIGVDSKLQEFVDEFFVLSIEKDITFTKNVSMGFKNIDRGKVIGTCYYGEEFREIEIDKEFYDTHSYNQKKALVFHELVHCYCGRGHDYGKDQKYPEAILGILKEKIVLTGKVPFFEMPPGYFPDNCPLSLMHPTIPGDWCLFHHFDHYQKEMLERCNPW